MSLSHQLLCQAGLRAAESRPRLVVGMTGSGPRYSEGPRREGGEWRELPAEGQWVTPVLGGNSLGIPSPGEALEPCDLGLLLSLSLDVLASCGSLVSSH